LKSELGERLEFEDQCSNCTPICNGDIAISAYGDLSVRDL
jgi:hypothetical protein